MEDDDNDRLTDDWRLRWMMARESGRWNGHPSLWYEGYAAQLTWMTERGIEPLLSLTLPAQSTTDTSIQTSLMWEQERKNLENWLILFLEIDEHLTKVGWVRCYTISCYKFSHFISLICSFLDSLPVTATANKQTYLQLPQTKPKLQYKAYSGHFHTYYRNRLICNLSIHPSSTGCRCFSRLPMVC